jgi:hypothetical protein
VALAFFLVWVPTEAALQDRLQLDACVAHTRRTRGGGHFLFCGFGEVSKSHGL